MSLWQQSASVRRKSFQTKIISPKLQFVGRIFRNVLQSMRKIASMITAWSPHDHGIMDHFAFSHPRSGCGCWLNQSVLPIWSNLFIKNNTVLGCDVCILIGRIQSSYLQTSPFRLIQSPFLLLQKSRLLLVKFAFFSSWISRTGWWLWWGWKPPSRWRVAGVHNVIGFWTSHVTGGIVTGEVVIPKPRECGGWKQHPTRRAVVSLVLSSSVPSLMTSLMHIVFRMSHDVMWQSFLHQGYGFGAVSSNLSVLDTEADQNDHSSGGCSHVFRREHVLHLKPKNHEHITFCWALGWSLMNSESPL